MMSDVPVQVLIAAFGEEKAADEALSELKQAKWAGLIGIQNAAVLRRDEKNKLHVKELKDWGGGKGAAFGGAVGAVLGVLTGPGILVAGAAGEGVAVGGFVAQAHLAAAARHFQHELRAALGHDLPGLSTGLQRFYTLYQQGYPQKMRSYQQT
mgnify:CR=1 FL=1